MGPRLGRRSWPRLLGVGATLVWSPFSNLWLYGQTAAIDVAKTAGLRLCLGSDWAPSGTTNVLWELKVADLWNRAQPQPVFTPEELCRLVTANPGDALARVWPHPVGRLVPGAAADLVVVAQRTPDVYANLIGATERDLRLVVVGGAARYGTAGLMRTAGAAHPTPIRVAGRTRQIDYGDPAVTWPSRPPSKPSGPIPRPPPTASLPRWRCGLVPTSACPTRRSSCRPTCPAATTP
jgi:5-methylthioadenosine/S-adenosylhomocysteine deaminase